MCFVSVSIYVITLPAFWGNGGVSPRVIAKGTLGGGCWIGLCLDNMVTVQRMTVTATATPVTYKYKVKVTSTTSIYCGFINIHKDVMKIKVSRNLWQLLENAHQ